MRKTVPDRKSREEERYVDEMKREPKRLSKDHPYSWQWEYASLSKEEREAHLRDLAGEPGEIEGQEELPF